MFAGALSSIFLGIFILFIVIVLFFVLLILALVLGPLALSILFILLLIFAVFSKSIFFIIFLLPLIFITLVVSYIRNLFKKGKKNNYYYFYSSSKNKYNSKKEENIESPEDTTDKTHFDKINEDDIVDETEYERACKILNIKFSDTHEEKIKKYKEIIKGNLSNELIKKINSAWEIVCKHDDI